jgi:RNA polymerase sigma-70 factor (ECF subfamily)
MHSTPGSLLEKLRRTSDPATWAYFVRLYTPLLHYWARSRLGLADADAADLVQDVFTILVQKLPDFHYDPSKRFRAWLWTIFINKSRDRRRLMPVAALEAQESVHATVPDPAEEVADREYRGYLVRRALALIQEEFSASTWQAFWLCVTTDQSAAEVAAALGLSVDAVYQAKSRVLRRLRRDLEGLLD